MGRGGKESEKGEGKVSEGNWLYKGRGGSGNGEEGKEGVWFGGGAEKWEAEERKKSRGERKLRKREHEIREKKGGGREKKRK